MCLCVGEILKVRGGAQQHYSILSIFNFNKNNIMIVLNFFTKPNF